jgi:hypothetical protein
VSYSLMHDRAMWVSQSYADVQRHACMSHQMRHRRMQCAVALALFVTGAELGKWTWHALV